MYDIQRKAFAVCSSYYENSWVSSREQRQTFNLCSTIFEKMITLQKYKKNVNAQKIKIKDLIFFGGGNSNC